MASWPGILSSLSAFLLLSHSPTAPDQPVRELSNRIARGASVKPSQSPSPSDGWLPRILHLPGRLLGDLLAKQPADNVQAHVDPGSDPRRADDPPVVHEAAVGVNFRLRGGLA